MHPFLRSFVFHHDYPKKKKEKYNNSVIDIPMIDSDEILDNSRTSSRVKPTIILNNNPKNKKIHPKKKKAFSQKKLKKKTEKKQNPKTRFL